MIEIFKETYSSESISDIFRDVSECLDPRFNEKAKALESMNSENIVYHVNFKFTAEDGTVQTLINSTYGFESLIDLEQDISDSFSELDVLQDKHGFFDGDLEILIQASEED